MSTGRWYPSVVTLYNGIQIIVGGVTGNIDLAKPEGNNPTYEYYPSKEGDWPRVLTILDWSFPYNLYPTVTQLPSGRVFIMSANKTVLLNPVTEEIYADVVPDLIAPDHAPFVSLVANLDVPTHSGVYCIALNICEQFRIQNPSLWRVSRIYSCYHQRSI
jgi:hypothetical protein